MSEKVKSAYCQVCGEQRKLTKEVKEGSKSSKWLLKEGYKTNNPLAFALFLPYMLIRFIFRSLGSLARLASGGTAYRCVVCGSKEGAKPVLSAT
jgi:hypothetical protein